MLPVAKASQHIMTSTHGIELDPRYEIRQITLDQSDFCKALAIYGFFLRTSIWTCIIREPKTANALRAFDKLSDYYNHSINSGLTYGIFDTQYEYQSPESMVKGGALYWNELDPADPYLACNMIEAMDFPLVSLALSYDMFHPRTADFEPSLLEVIPMNPSLMMHLADVPDLPSRLVQPTEVGRTLCRTGTVTKPGYERKGLMTALNRFVILEARDKGFKNIMIGTSALAGMAVHRVYTNPPSGCRSNVLHRFDVESIELTDKECGGRKVKPYVGGDLKEGWLVMVELT
jgi:hypothetical protein